MSRRSEAIVREVRALAESGVVEITLLGQTVNAYGRPRPGRVEGEIPFAELLRRVAAVPGIERLRFTSPHPMFVDDELIRCYAELPELCPHLHLPVQSGSDRVLADMNRRHTRAEYLQRVEQLRRARPGLTLTTDLIVAFPTETEGDFEQTLDLVERAEFTDSFSFKYSPRPGTPALRRGWAPLDAGLAQERLERLQALQRGLTLAHARARVGQHTTVLVEGASPRHPGQVRGRCPHNRVVNVRAAREIAPGTLLGVRLEAATPHSLLAVPDPGGVGEGAPSPASLPLIA